MIEGGRGVSRSLLGGWGGGDRRLGIDGGWSRPVVRMIGGANQGQDALQERKHRECRERRRRKKEKDHEDEDGEMNSCMEVDNEESWQT